MVGCYGRPELETPNLDSLAQSGIRFDRAYSCQPVCGPARSSIFTGTFPHTSGVWANNIPLGANVKTIGERLTDNGYNCAYTGKWHLDGTDYFGNGKCAPGWNEKYWYDGRRYLDDLTDKQKLLWRTKLDNAESIHKYKITEEFTWAHRCGDRALDFMKNRNKNKPAFLVVSYDEPHEPFTCPPPYCDKFKDFHYDYGKNINDTLKNKPQIQKEWAEFVKITSDPEKMNKEKQIYFACNNYVDYEIGRVLDAVDRHMPDALVIFTSDHGTPMYAHKLHTKGPAMYDEITRIPFIVKWKGHTHEKRVSEHPVSHINIVPTLLDAAGLEIPRFIQGKSILPALRDPKKRVNDQVFMEWNRYEVNHDAWGGLQPIRACFDGKHKLIINLMDTDELYDLSKDPEEMENLINSSKYAKIRDSLHDRILGWMDRTLDPFRSHLWEHRAWRKKRKIGWGGSLMTRPRPDDGYEPPQVLGFTGLEAKKDEYRRFNIKKKK
jgi:uncharacterized sulfatase